MFHCKSEQCAGWFVIFYLALCRTTWCTVVYFYFTKNSAGVVDIPFQTSFVFQLFFLFGIVDGLRYFYHLGSFRAS